MIGLVISLGMLKEWISDNKRSKEDKRVNEAQFKRLAEITETTMLNTDMMTPPKIGTRKLDFNES